MNEFIIALCKKILKNLCQPLDLIEDIKVSEQLACALNMHVIGIQSILNNWIN